MSKRSPNKLSGSQMLELSKIQAFLRNGSQPKEPTAKNLHVLRGYKPNTLVSYNSAAKKLVNSMKENGKENFKLPLTSEDIYDFCFWAGQEEGNEGEQDVSAKTLEKYLYGIKAWHLYHMAEYPTGSKARLKSCSALQQKRTPKLQQDKRTKQLR
ncbi:hypothetical protein PCANC_07056 [Puccinia coronata f. sp. avenae]|uniref:Core-binding (CB) domain-containing protein n=1 Tax=Puccinia coronata f. sp. avenae TaxID=200324 RepID=A0A2N5VZP5_9BASI|nr:hypothetical protein PCANC_07056 [Puccinia coronata f. sp. avenae]